MFIDNFKLSSHLAQNAHQVLAIQPPKVPKLLAQVLQERQKLNIKAN